MKYLNLNQQCCIYVIQRQDVLKCFGRKVINIERKGTGRKCVDVYLTHAS